MGGVGIAGTLLFAYFYFQPPPRDEESLCLKAAGSASAATEAAHRIVLIDKNDKWTDGPPGARLRRATCSAMRDALDLE